MMHRKGLDDHRYRRVVSTGCPSRGSRISRAHWRVKTPRFAPPSSVCRGCGLIREDGRIDLTPASRCIVGVLVCARGWRGEEATFCPPFGRAHKQWSPPWPLIREDAIPPAIRRVVGMRGDRRAIRDTGHRTPERQPRDTVPKMRPRVQHYHWQDGRASGGQTGNWMCRDSRVAGCGRLWVPRTFVQLVVDAKWVTGMHDDSWMRGSAHALPVYPARGSTVGRISDVASRTSTVATRGDETSSFNIDIHSTRRHRRSAMRNSRNTIPIVPNRLAVGLVIFTS
ncbi:hypothetical protein B0H16DRAFT_514988 [Mycena metata]|uniref:Uncharacterized protein n=1 Tax=Mycena metata TaxID=1033252 RepID=A0AAD7JD92_9AGAR|nr:hypothetical protein B0H16DRAFT_514988 [Mycena metata]